MADPRLSGMFDSTVHGYTLQLCSDLENVPTTLSQQQQSDIRQLINMTQSLIQENLRLAEKNSALKEKLAGIETRHSADKTAVIKAFTHSLQVAEAKITALKANSEGKSDGGDEKPVAKASRKLSWTSEEEEANALPSRVNEAGIAQEDEGETSGWLSGEEDADPAKPEISQLSGISQLSADDPAEKSVDPVDEVAQAVQGTVSQDLFHIL